MEKRTDGQGAGNEADPAGSDKGGHLGQPGIDSALLGDGAGYYRKAAGAWLGRESN